MADPWIKMRTNLDSDPRVVFVANDLKVSVANAIGALHFLWSCADTFSRDGYIGYSAEYIDKRVELPGFCHSLTKITSKGKPRPWLELCEDGVRICNFKDHNGETAKERAKAAKRMASSRAKNVPKKRNTIGTNPQPEQSRTEQKRIDTDSVSNSSQRDLPACLPDKRTMLQRLQVGQPMLDRLCESPAITPEVIEQQYHLAKGGGGNNPVRILVAALKAIAGIPTVRKGSQTVAAALTLVGLSQEDSAKALAANQLAKSRRMSPPMQGTAS